uniref:Uncharacterized protein n=1 Tax=Setaria italica TaxID=4555 RepID=K4AP47_SETIT
MILRRALRLPDAASSILKVFSCTLLHQFLACMQLILQCNSSMCALKQ